MQFLKKQFSIQNLELIHKLLFIVYVILAAVAIFQVLRSGGTDIFTIFRASWHHFIHSKPLYALYPDVAMDYFLYSPMFPLLFSPFAILPVKTGLIIWLFFNSIFCYFVFSALPLTLEKKIVFILLIAFDLLLNLQYTQTNPVVLALILLTWICVEKKQFLLASICIVLCFCIKSYGAIVAVVFLFEKNKLRIISYCLISFIALHLLSFIFISPLQVVQYYKDWFEIISGATILEKFSIYGIVQAFHFTKITEFYILVTAFILLIVFLVSYYLSGMNNRSYILSFLLIWVVVFNRSAESPTYILAMAGVILWYLNRPHSLYSSLLFWSTMFLASLFPIHVFAWLDTLRYQYYLKVILCLLVLTDILSYSLMQVKKNRKNLLVKK